MYTKQLKKMLWKTLYNIQNVTTTIKNTFLCEEILFLLLLQLLQLLIIILILLELLLLPLLLLLIIVQA